MKLKNYTPFIPFTFASRDQQQRDFGVFVLQGSFDIEHKSPLKPHTDQADLVVEDEYVGDVGQSSLMQENNLAPFKPNTDIHLAATAYAPGGKAKDKWLVRVRVGKLSKELLITGPRCWQRGVNLLKKLDEPEPITKLPIQYEYAFGGSAVDSKNITHAFPANPVGAGYEQQFNTNQATVMGPQILQPETFDLVHGQEYTPQGFAPISPHWQPRLSHAGTYDLIWEKTRWPDLPEDFKFDFYNSAHPDLIYSGYVQGNETIELHNLTPEGYLTATLPDYSLAMLVRYEDGEMRALPMMLDTIFLNPDKLEAQLTWRGIYSLEKPIRVLEGRIQLSSTAEAPKHEGELWQS